MQGVFPLYLHVLAAEKHHCQEPWNLPSDQLLDEKRCLAHPFVRQDASGKENCPLGYRVLVCSLPSSGTIFIKFSFKKWGDVPLKVSPSSQQTGWATSLGGISGEWIISLEQWNCPAPPPLEIFDLSETEGFTEGGCFSQRQKTEKQEEILHRTAADSPLVVSVTANCRSH